MLRLDVWILGAGLLVACRSSTPPAPAASDTGADGAADGGAGSVAITPCTSPIVIRAQIYGAFDGSKSGLAGVSMVVGMEHAPSFGSAGPSFGTVAALELEAPRFAAEYAPADLCSDEGSTSDRIAIHCITPPSAKISSLVVTQEGSELIVTRDGKSTRWRAPEWEKSMCFELHGLGDRRDLEPLRKTWRVDEPGCPRNAASPPLRIALRLDPVADGGGHSDAKATLVGAGPARPLGTMTNMSGAVTFRRLEGVNGVNAEASDDGVDRRFVYQLGDRAFFVAADGRVHAADLACGARAAFDVRVAARIQIVELPPGP